MLLGPLKLVLADTLHVAKIHMGVPCFILIDVNLCQQPLSLVDRSYKLPDFILLLLLPLVFRHLVFHLSYGSKWSIHLFLVSGLVSTALSPVLLVWISPQEVGVDDVADVDSVLIITAVIEL